MDILCATVLIYLALNAAGRAEPPQRPPASNPHVLPRPDLSRAGQGDFADGHLRAGQLYPGPTKLVYALGAA